MWDGKGRVPRLLAYLTALEARLPSLDFSSLKGRMKKEYFAAIQAGLDRNYGLTEEIFSGLIRKTLQSRLQDTIFWVSLTEDSKENHVYVLIGKT